MFKKNALLLLALSIAPSLAAMEKLVEEDPMEKYLTKSEQPHIQDIQAVNLEELYKTLKDNNVKAIEPEAITILEKIATLNSEDAKKILEALPEEDVQYMIPAMVIAKFMNDTTSITLLNEALSFHKKKTGTMNEKEKKMYEKYKQHLPKKSYSFWKKLSAIMVLFSLD